LSKLGFHEPTPIQRQAISILLSVSDFPSVLDFSPLGLGIKFIIVAYSNYLLLLASGQGMLCLCTHRLWQDVSFLAPDTYENKGIYLNDIVLCFLDSLDILYDDYLV
jgi:hypothetical protein